MELASRRRPGPPAPDPGRPGARLVIRTVGQRQTVAACCAASSRAGVLPGMTLAHARALMPGRRIETLPHDPDAEARALRRLAVWATRFTPTVATDPPDGLLLEVTGCDHLFGGPQGLVARVVRAAAGRGFTGRAALAPTFAGARALARFGPRSRLVVGPRDLRAALEPLPVAALELEDADHAALLEIGVDTIGQVLALGRRSLHARFGDRLLLRLDRMLGQAAEWITPVAVPEPSRCELAFDGPTTAQESVLAGARLALGRLVSALERRQRGVRRLRADLARPGLEPLAATVHLSRPSLSERHLWSLLRPRLESLHLGFGVESIRITAAATGPLRYQQTAHWSAPGLADGDPRAHARLGELIDILADRLGPGGVATVGVAATHCPERVFFRRPAAEPAPPVDHARLINADRPTALLEPPEPADAVALAPDGPPSRLRWRGRDHAVAFAAGPERIGLPWWLGRRGGRDYFRVRTDSALWLWVYRALPGGGWFVHGLWE